MEESVTALMKATRTAFSPSGIIFYFLYLLRSCAEREREEKGNEKKNIYIYKKPCDALALKGRKSDGGRTTEDQMRLMEIYNNLKLTSYGH